MYVNHLDINSFLSIGQLWFELYHFWMQSSWNMCWHRFTRTILSSLRYSTRQIAHAFRYDKTSEVRIVSLKVEKTTSLSGIYFTSSTIDSQASYWTCKFATKSMWRSALSHRTSRFSSNCVSSDFFHIRNSRKVRFGRKLLWFCDLRWCTQNFRAKSRMYKTANIDSK